MGPNLLNSSYFVGCARKTVFGQIACLLSQIEKVSPFKVEEIALSVTRLQKVL